MVASVQQRLLESGIYPSLRDDPRTVVGTDLGLIGLDDGVERGRFDISLFSQDGLQRAHAQFGLGKFRMVVVVDDDRARSWDSFEIRSCVNVPSIVGCRPRPVKIAGEMTILRRFARRFELAKWTVYCLIALEKQTKGWRRAAMQGKVALEEHFAIAETIQDSAGFAPEADWPELKGRLLDIQDRRLREMDAHGIEMMLLSLNAPAVQAIREPRRPMRSRAGSNDFMAEQIAAGPKRFARARGFADAKPRACDPRTDALRARTRVLRRAGQRL